MFVRVSCDLLFKFLNHQIQIFIIVDRMAFPFGNISTIITSYEIFIDAGNVCNYIIMCVLNFLQLMT